MFDFGTKQQKGTGLLMACFRGAAMGFDLQDRARLRRACEAVAIDQ